MKTIESVYKNRILMMGWKGAFSFTVLRLGIFFLVSAGSPWLLADNDMKGSGQVEAKVREVTDSDLQSITEAANDRIRLSKIYQVLDKNSSQPLALNELGIIYFKQNKLGIAEIVFQRSLKAQRSAATLYNLGVIYQKQGDSSKAIQYFRDALKEDSRHIESMAELGTIYLKYRDFSRAGGGFDQLYQSLDQIESKDLRQVVLNNYAVAMSYDGNISKANKIFSQALSEFKGSPRILVNYATHLVEVAKDKTKAKEIINQIKFLNLDKSINARVKELEAKL